MGQKIVALVKGTRWTGRLSPQRTVTAASSPGAPSMVTNAGCCKPRASNVQGTVASRRALLCHGLNRQEDLLPITAHAHGRQYRDGGGQHQMHVVFLCQAGTAPCFPAPLSLAPTTAHHVLAGPLEQCKQRPLPPARMGARQISCRDQRLHSLSALYRPPPCGETFYS